MRACIAIGLLFSGCVHVSVSEHDLAGSYTNSDGYWPRSLDLRQDGTFAYDQLTDVIKEAKDGTAVSEGSWGLRGHWRFLPPDRVELAADGKPAKVVLFVRTYSAGKIAILEPDLFPDILNTWSPDRVLRFLKKREQEPNQLPDPMPLRGAGHF